MPVFGDRVSAAALAETRRAQADQNGLWVAAGVIAAASVLGIIATRRTHRR
jgi:hypothetical protein